MFHTKSEGCCSYTIFGVGELLNRMKTSDHNLLPLLAKVGLAMLLITLTIISSCVKPPEYSEIPFIEFQSINTNTVIKGDTATVIIQVYFEDGDGDLGDDTTQNVQLFDSRIPNFPIPFHIDSIEPRSKVEDISGTIELRLNPFVMAWDCLNDEDVDTTTLSLYIIDRAGNQSNTISIPEPMRIICN